MTAPIYTTAAARLRAIGPKLDAIVDASGNVIGYSVPNASGFGTVETYLSTNSFADLEVPAGTINSANTVFTLAHTPSPAASLQLFRNGVLQAAGGTDYALSGSTITYVTAPLTGDTHVCSYRY